MYSYSPEKDNMDILFLFGRYEKCIVSTTRIKKHNKYVLFYCENSSFDRYVSIMCIIYAYIYPVFIKILNIITAYMIHIFDTYQSNNEFSQ